MEENQEPPNKPVHIKSIILWQGAKNTQWRENGLLNKRCRENWKKKHMQKNEMGRLYCTMCKNKLKMT